jgi:hypothetical protein
MRFRDFRRISTKDTKDIVFDDPLRVQNATLIGSSGISSRRPTSMRCPHCSLFNPPTALRCDCGYDFASGHLETPYDGRRSTRSASRWPAEITAFFVVPFVATSTWYLLMLCALALVNGRLRWRTDVLAMALGAVIVGLPTAIAITLVLAVPMYLLVRWTGRVSLQKAVAGGATIGLCAALLFWGLAREWTALSPLRGVLIGVTSAVAWWYAAGKPDRASAMRSGTDLDGGHEWR